MDLLFEPWVKTTLSLILPVMVLILAVRIALLQIAGQNRKEAAEIQYWQQRQQEESQTREQDSVAEERRVCPGCGAPIEGEHRLCPNCGMLQAG